MMLRAYGSMGSLESEDATTYLRKKGAMALGFGRMRLEELRRYADEGHWTWTVLGFVSGLVIMLLSLLSFLSHLTGLSWFTALVDIYIFLAGLVLCVLECKHKLLTQTYVDRIHREARFLYRPYGRACFYFFVGLLIVGLQGVLGLVCGLCVCAVALLVFASSLSAFKHLSALRNNIHNETELAARFQAFDADRSGYLETVELAALCAALGAPLTENEAEAALLTLDLDADGRIAYHEFSEWWKGKEEYLI